MSAREDVLKKLKSALVECELHTKRLDFALSRLNAVIPISETGWRQLDDETVANIDQLLFRFGKLQDAMGRRLFPSILDALAELDETASFIDKLNRLEKLAVLSSAQQWIELRELRNQATHEYPDAPDQNAENVNLIHESVPSLRNILTQATEYINTRILN